MKLQFFGPLKDISGARDVEHQSTAPTVAALIEELASDNPALGAVLSKPPVRYVVDNEIMTIDAPIHTGSVVGFLPPFSGG